MRIAICLGMLAFSSVAVAQDPAKSFQELQGTWKLLAVTENGVVREFPDHQFIWVITGKKVHYGGEHLATLSIHIGESPRPIDIEFQQPKHTNEGIYKLEDDKLTLCVNAQPGDAKDRPADFETKNFANRKLLIFERIKDRTGDPTEGLGGFVGVAIRADADTKTLIIDNVLKNSPAEMAGLMKDDVLRKVDGIDASDLLSVVKLIRRAKPKSDLVLRVARAGKDQDITIKVGVLPFHILE
jgi:uncharacterized protein (TIGR03067 family)